LNQTTNARQSAPASLLPDIDLIDHLRAQRHRIAGLSSEAGSLCSRGRRLLAESNTLAVRLDQSFTDLASAFLANRKAVAELRLNSFARHRSARVRAASEGSMERVLTDSPDLVDALQEATDILKLEFTGTQGSGSETLAKCEKALERNRSICTLELPLY
jgi:hypothetical protein